MTVAEVVSVTVTADSLAARTAATTTGGVRDCPPFGRADAAAVHGQRRRVAIETDVSNKKRGTARGRRQRLLGFSKAFLSRGAKTNGRTNERVRTVTECMNATDSL